MKHRKRSHWYDNHKVRKLLDPTRPGNVRSQEIMRLMNQSPVISRGGLTYKLIAVKALLVAIRNYRGKVNYN